ncbi:MAG TPA: endopeptidase La [Roseiflexaceae bacterium]|nr:endopeptidase La [Roseiflexaceae bacterium]
MSEEVIRREPGEDGPPHQDIPQELAILPLFNVVVYPQTVIPLAVGQEQSIRLIDDAMVGQRMVGLVTLKSEDRRPEQIGPDDFYQIGTAAVVHRLLRLPDNTLRVAIQGVERIQIEQIVGDAPYYRARVRVIPDQSADDIEIKALMRNAVGLAAEILQRLPNPSEELHAQITNEEDPRRLAYLLALTMLFRSNVAERQSVLELTEVREKLVRISAILTRELEVLRIGQEIQSQVQSGIDKNQREYVLREQLRAIRRELGEDDQDHVEVERLRQALAQAGLSEEASTQAQRELDRLAQMPPAAAEYGLIRTYLETLISLPWQRRTEDQIDLAQARRVLDEDHYDLDEIKARILEYLAVRELRLRRLGTEAAAQKGAILCFVGPPGVGKTSLGRSIARAMNRTFLRVSLGGVRDEAEIRGHRRTYIGAMPGTIIQSLRRVGVANPVCMLDEIDKLGSDFRGDPSSALLEVLDPEQNDSFRDHYLDVAWDLSPVLFIATANTLQTIPAPLLDRMEVIQLSGYTVRQKQEIARRYLVPEQLRAHALTEDDLAITDAALLVAIEEYTREAGVRNLEREVGALCRKAAVEIAARPEPQASRLRPQAPITIDADLARSYLGRRRYHAEASERIDRPGIVTGLVWTPVGGDIIYIEATAMPGGRGFQLTGQLGEVMRESAQAALSYVRAESVRLGIDPRFYETHDIHLHVPSGAIPKDGPSAGVAMVTALASLLTGRLVRDSLAMTGEITLRGKVLPIGGVKEKLLAAHRAGIRTIILPRRNADDLEDIPAEVRAELTVVLADRVEEVLGAALEPRPSDPPVEAAPGFPPRQET